MKKKITTTLLVVHFVLLANVAFAQTTTIKTGSYILNMGSATPTVANSLKPYGLVVSLLRQSVPIHVVISSTKGFDGVDFVYNGVTYKGGTFIIPAEYITPAIESATINAAAWSGVIKAKTVSNFSVNVTYTIKSAPRFVMDAQNGAISQSYLTAAGITNTAFPGIISFKAPSTLNSCDDVFSMPHADPTFAIHGKLYDWVVNQKGSLYMGCHSPSVFEAITAPTINAFGYPPGLKFNMLTTNGLINFGSHDDATFPLSRRLPADPVGQYIGNTDAAHDGGSEQIYLPTAASTWRPGAKILLWDPTHPQVNGGAAIASPTNTNAAVVTVYGRAYDLATAGWVMYQAGHTVAGTGIAEVGAQRKYLNFALYSQLEKAPQITTTIPASPYAVGTPYNMSVSVTSIVANSFTYAWSASCGGTFSNPSAASTLFTPSASSANCIITCTVTDPCGRKSFTSTAVVVNSGPQPPVGNADSYTFLAACVTPGTYYDLDVLANDTDPENAALTITTVSGNNGTWTVVGNKVRYRPTVNFTGTAAATYTVCDPGLLCATNVNISVSIGASTPTTLTVSNDAVTINEDALASINVLGNDVYTGGVKLTVLTQPANGVAVLNIDNTITYQPNHDFGGSTNTFTYRLCNEQGTCGTATVTVTVTNDACDGSTYQTGSATPTLVSGNGWSNVHVNSTGGNPATTTTAYPINAGTDRLLVVAVEVSVNGANLAPTTRTVTWGGKSLTYLTTNPTAGNRVFAYLYYLTEADIATAVGNDLVVTMSLSGIEMYGFVTFAAVYQGVDQTTPMRNGVNLESTTTTSTTATLNTADFTAGDQGIFIAGFGLNSATSTAYSSTVSGWTGSSALFAGGTRTAGDDGSFYGGVATRNATTLATNETTSMTVTAAQRTSMSVASIKPTGASCTAIPNRAPLAVDDEGYTTTSTSPVTVNVKSNDLDYDGDAITLNTTFTLTELFGSKTGAAVGTATRTAQQLVFTPASTFKGTAIIQYQITATGGTDNARLYVTVTNSPPIAGNDAASLVNNAAGTASTTVNVATNDSDPDGAGLQNPTIVSGPRFGAASFSATTLTYTPTANFVGIDTVQYQVCELADPADCNPSPICVTAYAIFTVTNAPRVTTNVTRTILPCTSYTLNLVDASVADKGLVPLTANILTGPVPALSGTLTNNNDGTFTYVPANGSTGSTFTFNVTDANGVASTPASSTLTFTVTNPVNTAPIAADATEDVLMDQAFPISLDDYTSDPDGHALTTPTITILPTNGSISYLPNGLAVYTPNPGYYGTDQFTYQVCDLVIDPGTCATSQDLCDLGVITFNIAVPNITVAINDQNTTWSGVATQGNLLTNDFDTDPIDEPLVFMGFNISGTLQTTGSFSVAGVSQAGAPVANAGTLTITTDGKYTFIPETTFSGSVTLDYQIRDANVNPAYDAAKLIIEVRDIDATANNLIALNDEAVSYQTTITENVLDNDLDPEGNTMTLSGYTYDTDGDGSFDGSGTIGSAVVIGGTDINGVEVSNVGTLTLNANGAYTFVPKTDFIGYTTIVYEVCDNGSPMACENAILDIIILPNANGASNDPPFAGDDFDFTDGTTPATGTVLGNDYDPNGDPITVTAQSITTPEGTLVLNTNGTYTFTAASGFTGPVNFPYQICDNGSPALCAEATLFILVEEGQQTNPDINATYVGIPAIGDVSTNDVVESGSTYGNPTDAGSNPTGASISMNSNGTYTFTASQVGVYTYLVNVCAPGQTPFSSCPIEILTINVLNATSTTNLPVANVDIASTQLNTAVTLKTLTNDASGNVTTSLVPSTVTVLTSVPPAIGSVSVNGLTGDITFTPATGWTGEYIYTYQVCDNGVPANCATATQVVTVLAETSANSTLAADDYDFTISTTPATGNVLTNDTDPEGNTLTVTAQNITVSGKGTLVLNTDGSYTFTATSGFSGPINFVYNVCDNGTPQACASATLYILVGEQESNPDINATFVNVAVAGDVNTNDQVLGGTTYGTTPTLVSSPSGSIPSITMNANGTYSFTADIVGAYVYAVEVCAPAQSSPCPTELLSIDVSDFTVQTNPPYAHTDIATALQNTPVTLKTLANDVVGNLGGILVPATVTVISGTEPNSITQGSLSVNTTTGEITFTPIATFVGTISYTYEVCDNTSPTALCARAIQEVTVLPTGAPNSTIAADDFNVTTASVAATGNVLNNDTDPEGNTITATAQNVTVPGVGTLVLNTNGTYTFTPVAGFSGPTSFEYTACDNGTPQACATATLNILVIGIFDVSGTVYIDENGGTINGTGTAVAGGSQLYISAVVGGVAVQTVAVNVDGTYELIGLTNDTYTLVLHYTSGGSVTSALPVGWVNSAEGLILTGDGNPNGSISTINAGTTSANFAIAIDCGIATDTDGDGVLDCNDLDDDNDGILDLDELLAKSDADGDGIPNHLDLDSDNDGIADVLEAGGTDPDNNGIAGTGASNVVSVDANGVPTIASGGYDITVAAANHDADDISDPYDIDSDNDGIVDVIESQYTILYIAPTGLDTDNDGIDDAFDVASGGNFIGTFADTDDDGTPDIYDDNSDGDGLSDMVEAAQGTYVAADADGDGLADVFDDYDLINDSGSTNADNDNQTPTSPFPNTYAALGRVESNWRDYYVIWYDCTNNVWKDNTGAVVTLDGTNFGNRTLMPGCCVASIPATTRVKKVMIPSCGGIELPGCLEVADFVINKGIFRLLATNESSYGQYLGPRVENVEFNMIMNEDGWHNIAFPVELDATAWAAQNNSLTDPRLVKIHADIDSTNFLWWDPSTSSGKERGFVIDRNGVQYSTHSYGTWNPVVGTQDLSVRGFNYYIDPFYTNTTRTLTAKGTSHDGEIVYSTSDNFGGWNLIPNIYPVTISTVEMYNQGFFTGFDKVVWIWDPGDPNQAQPTLGLFGSGAYIAFDPQTGVALNGALFNSAAKIAPFQSFWIRRTSASTARRVDFDGTNYNAIAEAVDTGVTIDPQPLDTNGNVISGVNTATGTSVPVTMKPSFRSLCDITKHYKTNYDLLLVGAVDPANKSLTDFTEIVFDDAEFTNAYDLGFDIDKLGVRDGAPMVFTVLDKHALVINKMKYPTGVTTVPMGFYATENGKKFEINMQQMPAGWRVYLEDKLTAAWHDLTLNSYSFTNNTEFRMDRFVLHFSMKSDAIAKVNPEALAWGTSEGIDVRMNNMRSETAEILVTNLLGQVLHHNKTVSTLNSYSIPMNEEDPQIYLVTVITPELTQTIKVVR